MFDKLKDLMQLKKKMGEVKQRLDTIVIKVQSPAKYFEITISGSQDVKEFKVLTDISKAAAKDIEEDMKALINKAVKDSQVMAAQAMGDLAGLGGISA